MNQNTEFSLSWIQVGGICGTTSMVSYLSAVFLPLPDTLGDAAAFAFGPLLAIGMVGLYHCLAIYPQSPLIQIAVFFAIAGGVTVLVMLSTQQAIVSILKQAIGKASGPVKADLYRKIEDGLNAVHLGMDVAWDVLISTAVILFGIAMLRHPRFGKIIGGLGIVFGGDY